MPEGCTRRTSRSIKTPAYAGTGSQRAPQRGLAETARSAVPGAPRHRNGSFGRPWRGHGTARRAGGQRRSRPRPSSERFAVLPVATYVAVTGKLESTSSARPSSFGAARHRRRAAAPATPPPHRRRGSPAVGAATISTDTREPTAPALPRCWGDILSRRIRSSATSRSSMQ